MNQKCPSLAMASTNSETVEQPVTKKIKSLVNTIWVVFDLETTGFSKVNHEIIEIAAVILGDNGKALDDASFSSFVKPKSAIPSTIIELTGIQYSDICDSPPFFTVGNHFLDFIFDTATKFEHDENFPVHQIILVAHNGISFDIPFLLHAIKTVGLWNKFNLLKDRLYCLDTMKLCRNILRIENQVVENFRLATLFTYSTAKIMSNAHRAMGDVDATVAILKHNIFWERRKDFIERIAFDENQLCEKNDGDSNGEISKFSSDSSSSSDLNSETETMNIGNDQWFLNQQFDGFDANSIFESKRRERPQTRQEVATNKDTDKMPISSTRLLMSANSVNSPTKAWRQIFTNAILNKIIKYTNEYGEKNHKNWIPVDRSDLMDFISILFLMSVQRRKDKPSNWFSDNQLLECQAAKQIMTGLKFHTILRYLHCCPLQQPIGDAYDPIFKIAEFSNYLQERFTKLYEPGQRLSLDESLIRAFGRIKFKVRIITKSARYGIKVFVITDAKTAYVLNVKFYTGKTTYGTGIIEEKKTVKVVTDLCQRFEGTFRTIYVDRFYTSIDMMKALDAMSLCITGTLMQNRLPKDLQIAKSSALFKKMNRGDYKYHRLHYQRRGEGKGYSDAGLVCWKDKNMVYCLSNEVATNKNDDECRRRSHTGILTLKRPKMISKYNEFMGGVDIADIKRLHCNSTIMGLNRWWLKLFFYLLDVGTSNALVVYNETQDNGKHLNLVQFKCRLLESFVGSRMGSIPSVPVTEHMLIRINNQRRCAYCAVFSKIKRTRSMCNTCMIPLCSIGNGKCGMDCFSLSHENNTIQKIVHDKFKAMQLKTNKRSNS